MIHENYPNTLSKWGSVSKIHQYTAPQKGYTSRIQSQEGFTCRIYQHTPPKQGVYSKIHQNTDLRICQNLGSVPSNNFSEFYSMLTYLMKMAPLAQKIPMALTITTEQRCSLVQLSNSSSLLMPRSSRCQSRMALLGILVTQISSSIAVVLSRERKRPLKRSLACSLELGIVKVLIL